MTHGQHQAGAPAIELHEAMSTARALRRYKPDPVPDEVLARCLEAATWAPSGSNMQHWRFLVLRSPEVRAVLGPAFRKGWEWVVNSVYRAAGVPTAEENPRMARLANTMQELADNFESVPVYVMFCIKMTGFVDEFLEGGSIYPAMQNFLLAARAEGLGAFPTTFFTFAEKELREVIGIPDGWRIAALLAVGWPVGRHGPVRRRPLSKVSALDRWDQPFIRSES